MASFIQSICLLIVGAFVLRYWWRNKTIPKNQAKLINTEHPSYDVHEALWKTLKAHAFNFDSLIDVERNFLRVYEFESRLANGGLIDFFSMVSNPEAWRQTEAAFYTTGMPWWGDVFRRLMSVQKQNILKCVTRGGDDDKWEAIDTWSDAFWAAVPKTGIDERLYIESLLDNYVRDNYPWAKDQ